MGINMDKKIDFEFRVTGDRQGGQHAVLYWLFSQFRGRIFYKNNAMRGHNILKRSQFPSLELFRSNIFFDNDNDNDNDTIATVALYEDKSVNYINNLPYLLHGEKKYDIIILRDPYNLFASKIHGWRSYYKNSKRLDQFDERLIAWKQKAEEVLSGKGYFINFNKWHINKIYRKEIVSAFPKEAFKFNDSAKHFMPKHGGKSQWSGRKFMKEANKLDLFNRYKKIIKDPLMIRLMEDKEVAELSNQIFGKIIE